MIKAECHSDDRCVEVKFDATPWFNQASDKAILDLFECGWRGDYPADDVAIFMADCSDAVAEMFQYINLRGTIETIGFECSVDQEQAMTWLMTNRPNLYKLILPML
jgi:hypothetical protein